MKNNTSPAPLCDRCQQPKTQNARQQWCCKPCRNASFMATCAANKAATGKAITAPKQPVEQKQVAASPSSRGRFHIPKDGRFHIPKDAEILVRFTNVRGEIVQASLSLADLAASIGRSVLRVYNASHVAHPDSSATLPKPPVVKPVTGAPTEIHVESYPTPWDNGQFRATLSVALSTERLRKDGVIAIVHGKQSGHYSAKRPVALDPYETAIVVLRREGEKWVACANNEVRGVRTNGQTYPLEATR
jgi:hypothetical protein